MFRIIRRIVGAGTTRGAALLLVASLLASGGCGGGSGSVPAPPDGSVRSWEDRPFVEANAQVRQKLDVFVFPDNPVLPYPSGPPVTDAQARALLEQTARSQGANVEALLGLYDGSRLAFPDSVPLTQLVPAQDNDLRAALAVLSLTPEGALALRAITTSSNNAGQPVNRVFYDDPFPSPSASAIVTVETTGIVKIHLNPRLRGSSLEQISALLAHEACHQDRPNSLNEEVFGRIVQGMHWFTLAARNPALVTSTATLNPGVAINNTYILAFLNSGRGKAGFTPRNAGAAQDPSVNIFKNGIPYKSYIDLATADIIALDLRNYDGSLVAQTSQSPGSPLSQALYALWTGGGSGGSVFSATAIEDLDNAQHLLTDVEAAVAIADTFGFVLDTNR